MPNAALTVDQQRLLDWAADTEKGAVEQATDGDRTLVLRTAAAFSHLQVTRHHIVTAVCRDGCILRLCIDTSTQEERHTHHVYVPTAQHCSLALLVSTALGTTEAHVHTLFALGAVYAGHVVRNRCGQWAIEGLRRATQDLACETVAGRRYIRLSTTPFRYPEVHTYDWTSRIRKLHDEWLVVEKPNGVPSVPTTYNLYENALAQVAQALKISRSSLYPVQRLDTCTSGLLLLALNSRAAKTLGQVRLVKQYCALTTSMVMLGALNHWCRNAKIMKPPGPRIYAPYDSREPEIYKRGHAAQWKSAHSHVLGCVYNPQHNGYHTTLQLGTGRTHQLRLQLAAEGACIVGDTRYGPVNGQKHSGHACDDSTDLMGPEPAKIALHAMRLVVPWDGQEYTIEAGPPWWLT